MKKKLILLLLIANLGLGVQSFAITQDELNAQVDEAALNPKFAINSSKINFFFILHHFFLF